MNNNGTTLLKEVLTKLVENQKTMTLKIMQLEQEVAALQKILRDSTNRKEH